MIVSGTSKRKIQEKTKALAHAATDVSDKGMASIHLDVQSMTVKIKLKPPLTTTCNGPTNVVMRKTALRNGDCLQQQEGVAVNLGRLAVEAGTHPGGDVVGKSSPGQT